MQIKESIRRKQLEFYNKISELSAYHPNAEIIVGGYEEPIDEGYYYHRIKDVEIEKILTYESNGIVYNYDDIDAFIYHFAHHFVDAPMSDTENEEDVAKRYFEENAKEYIVIKYGKYLDFE